MSACVSYSGLLGKWKSIADSLLINRERDLVQLSHQLALPLYSRPSVVKLENIEVKRTLQCLDQTNMLLTTE